MKLDKANQVTRSLKIIYAGSLHRSTDINQRLEFAGKEYLVSLELNREYYS